MGGRGSRIGRRSAMVWGPGAIAAGLLLTGTTLVGCGSGSAGNSGRAATKHTAHPVAAQTRTDSHAISRTQALAFASEVNLQPADLVGFKSQKAEPESAGERHSSAQFERCVETGSGQSLAEAKSKQFERESNTGALYASSDVEVLTSVSAAEKDLAAVRGAKFEQCIRQAFLQSLTQGAQSELKGASLHRASVFSAAPTAAGASGFGWIAQATLRYHGIAFPFSVELEGFVDGRAIVVLTTAALPGRFPASLEQDLLATLLRRAEKHRP